VAFLYGRAGRLTAQNGGFRPGQHTQRIEEIKPGDDPAPYGSLGRGAPVLKGMNLTIQVGEMVALVGLSGSGKTSLVSLILRFYDATSGAIELGGVPITALQPNHLRARVATVPQEPALFSVSMHDNIAYGMTGVSREKVEAAAKLSNAFDFISSVRARRGRLSALSGFLCKSVFYGAFVQARRALNSQKRRFPARADARRVRHRGRLARHHALRRAAAAGGDRHGS
jgi:ABC-type multidrug transport system fused ATPase/permease subunit